MAEQSNSVRIPDSAVKANYATALSILDNAESAVSSPGQATSESVRPRFISPVAGAAATVRTQKAGFKAALKGDSSDPVLSPARHAVYFNLRRALAVGITVSEYFVEPRGFLSLGERNSKGTLTSQADKDRFQALVRIKAAIAMFAASAWLASATAEKPSGKANDPGDIPLGNTSAALGHMIGFISEAIRDVKSDADVLAAIARACADLMDRAETDANRALGPLAADFSASSYAIEEDSFRLSGFSRPSQVSAAKVVEVAPKRPDEVIGNHIAKAQAMRLARMIACHDFQKGKNPFVEIGGFVFTSIGDGAPGTGKTTLIQMAATLIKGYCDVFGYPFRYENFGVDQISEYQGKSGQNCQAFIDRVLDPKSIGFGTIDDIDQVAGRRDDKRSSSGAQEVTAVLMNAFAGAGTIVRGNASFFMASNYPEAVDDALRQRAALRWLIDGPQTRDDYVDILALLLGKSDIPIGDHELFASQAIRKMVAQAYEAHGRPQEEKLVEIWEGLNKEKGHPASIADLGTYLYRIKEADPRFTGRAVKNIADSVKTRSMDVDLPDEWFTSPEPFAAKSFDEKLALLKPLRTPITIEMVIQEINRYADSEFRYADKSDEADIERLLREDRIAKTATARLKEIAKDRADG